MKVKLIKNYNHIENSKKYKYGETVDVEDNINSTFYHVWLKDKFYLDVIPKDICKKIKQIIKKKQKMIIVNTKEINGN